MSEVNSFKSLVNNNVTNARWPLDFAKYNTEDQRLILECMYASGLIRLSQNCKRGTFHCCGSQSKYHTGPVADKCNLITSNCCIPVVSWAESTGCWTKSSNKSFKHLESTTSILTADDIIQSVLNKQTDDQYLVKNATTKQQKFNNQKEEDVDHYLATNATTKQQKFTPQTKITKQEAQFISKSRQDALMQEEQENRLLEELLMKRSNQRKQNDQKAIQQVKSKYNNDVKEDDVWVNNKKIQQLESVLRNLEKELSSLKHKND